MSLASCSGFGLRSDRAVRARNRRNPERFHRLLGGDLVAHQPDVLGLRADEGDLMSPHDLCKMCVFREKAVTGMDGVRAGDLTGRNNGGNVQIGLRGLRRPHAHAFVRHAHMHRVRIGGGMDRDGCDAHFLAGPVDPERDLAAVRDENFLEHSLLDPHQRLAEFDRLSVADENLGDLAGNGGGDGIHRLHRFDDAQRAVRRPCRRPSRRDRRARLRADR